MPHIMRGTVPPTLVTIWGTKEVKENIWLESAYVNAATHKLSEQSALLLDLTEFKFLDAHKVLWWTEDMEITGSKSFIALLH
jgi:hypothetical protein